MVVEMKGRTHQGVCAFISTFPALRCAQCRPRTHEALGYTQHFAGKKLPRYDVTLPFLSC